jgi:predicted homoserine dehydrogenase-like protein
MGIIVPLFHGKNLLVRLGLNAQAAGIGMIKQKNYKKNHPDEYAQQSIQRHMQTCMFNIQQHGT